MAEFPHLPLPRKANGLYNAPRGGGSSISTTTLDNLRYRLHHGKKLQKLTDNILESWQVKQEARLLEELPELPNSNVIPIFLQIDSDFFDVDSLHSFGIEVISEEESGFIIGASADNFKSLKDKIESFLKEKGKFKNTAAKLWNIIIGEQWRLEQILSEELIAKWQSIKDTDEIIVDVSIACNLKTPSTPQKKPNESYTRFIQKYQSWQARKEEIENRRIELEEQRQEEFKGFITELNGEIISSFVGYPDSFSCRVKINGKGLKDMVFNYQYLFDVTEYDNLTYHDFEKSEDIQASFETLPPDAEAPKVCIIDSGIQEGHQFISEAIDSINSKCYLKGTSDTADYVANGGHGTKVAGAVLYSNNIIKSGQFKFNIWIQNARVMDKYNQMPQYLYPPDLLKQIVNDYHGTRIFNLSITSSRQCKVVHMSDWAATIDYLMWEKEILFVVSAGNISINNVLPNNPGIAQHLAAGRKYPGYLLERSSRIANPAQSCFALTVGSVCIVNYEDLDRKSFGSRNEPSSFSRTGLGLWGMIKPDVVEYAGDFIYNKVNSNNISLIPQVASEVVKTTITGGYALGFDVGTSFSAPKITHIAAILKKEITGITPLMIKTLIVQSARLPDIFFENPTLEAIRTMGYGIPNKQRAIENSNKRITLIGEGKIAPKNAQIYTIKIPNEIRRAGNEFRVLIEVTMSFIAIPRRTRRKTQSYLSTWVDWRSSKMGESYNGFKKRIIKYINDDTLDDDTKAFNWQIRERIDWGVVKGIKRQDNSVQKDWMIIDAYNLPEEFSIAVIGHTGWEKDVSKDVPFSVAISFEVLDAEIDIYEMIKVENEIELEDEIRVSTMYES